MGRKGKNTDLPYDEEPELLIFDKPYHNLINDTACCERATLSDQPELKCLLLNACSILKSDAFDTLHSYLAASKISFAFITDTWLASDTITDAELSHDGRFQLFRRDRSSRGGGVLILVKSSIACAPLDVKLSSDIELAAVDLLWENHRNRCICVYFLPRDHMLTFMNECHDSAHPLRPCACPTQVSV